METPILLIIFNRPDKVRVQIEALAKIQPAQLFVSADGPRPNNTTDNALCAAARAELETISWPCTVHKNFSETNLGVHPGVEAAITWFFTNVEAGIILEDDCIPHKDFFTFATELLSRYAHDDRVMMISGDYFDAQVPAVPNSYFFGRYASIWGWATWKRAWSHYDTTLHAYPEFKKRKTLNKILPNKFECFYWNRYFKQLYRRTKHSWDAKWTFAMWANDGVAIFPRTNLIQNVGAGHDASNTLSVVPSMHIKSTSISFPLSHPTTISVYEDYDRVFFKSQIRPTFSGYVMHGKRLFKNTVKKYLAKIAK